MRGTRRSSLSGRSSKERAKSTGQLPASIDWRPVAIIIGCVLLVTALFLYQEHRIAGTWGYSLDDSWIYATMARNVATGHGFSFNPDEPVAGSTGPLYTFVLALFYFLFREVVWSAKVFGILCQIGSAVAIYAAVRRMTPGTPGIALWAGVVAGTAPALVWGALSGMEISCYILVVSLGILFYVRGRTLLAVFVWSLGVWLRPDGLFLVALAVFFGSPREFPKRALVAAPALLTYFGFNVMIGGSWMPQTVGAKAHFGFNLTTRTWNLFREWAAIWGVPYRPADDLEMPVLLLPLLAIGAAATIRRWPVLALYLIGFPIALSLFRDHSGSHKRYILYVIPFGVALASAGVQAIRERLHPRTGTRLVGAVAMACLVWQLGFTFRQAETHGWNVQNIEGMQRTLGEFAGKITRPGDRIAANDIGAIGYFSGRPVVDLMGLITPMEPLPVMLSKYKPEMLIVFVDWFHKDALWDPQSRGFVFVDADTTSKYMMVGAVELKHNTISAKDQMLAFRRLGLNDPAPEPLLMEVR
jgi:arabinofuranosyltransferase